MLQKVLMKCQKQDLVDMEDTRFSQQESIPLTTSTTTTFQSHLQDLVCIRRKPTDHVLILSFCLIDGSVCIEKTDFVEKLERQQIKECWHQNIKACHFSSVTEFKSMQQKKCEENTFVKTCKINFKEVALNYTVRTCHKPLVQQCKYRHHNHRPVTKCRTWFETTCNTTLVVDAYGSHKGGQQAWCEKVPKKICAPDHCAMVEGTK